MVEKIIVETPVTYEGFMFPSTSVPGTLLLTDKRLVFRAPEKKIWRPKDEDVFQIPAESLIGCGVLPYDEVHRGKFVYTYKKGKIFVMTADRAGAFAFDVGFEPSHAVWKSKIDDLIQAIKQGRGDQVAETPACLVKNIENGYYGNILLTKHGKYLGGHPAHLDAEFGHMYLTEQLFAFLECGANLRDLESPFKLNNWMVKVPLNRIAAAEHAPHDILRRSGKKLQIVLPYIDDNDIQREPRFEVWRFTFIQNEQLMREWTNAICARVAEIKHLGGKGTG